jgi:hypothetical protein
MEWAQPPMTHEEQARELLKRIWHIRACVTPAEPFKGDVEIVRAALAACALEEFNWWDKRVAGAEINYFRDEYAAHQATLERAAKGAG